MADIALDVLVRHCDRRLSTAAFADWEGARNGLQVQNRGRVGRLAAAVDARRATVLRAAEAGAQLLLVHHGLFWSPMAPWTVARYELIRLLVENDLAIYSAHLPLDAHPVLGNNALLAAALGLRKRQPFFECKGRMIGFWSSTRVPLEELSNRLGAATGRAPLVIRGGPAVCRRVGVVSGGAGAELKLAADAGLDTFITGEGPHWTHAMAEELGLNVLYGGHYATETFGVRALAAELSRRFGLPWDFIDYPTGL